jgi:nucleotide-binding universal stress UspA family protein
MALAKRFGSEILLLSVPEAEPETPRLQQYLDGVAAALRTRGLTVRTIVTGSGPAGTIVAVSESESMDLIMMATHGRGGIQRGILIGSVAGRVVQSTQCPVFLIPVRNLARLQAQASRKHRKVLASAGLPAAK